FLASFERPPIFAQSHPERSKELATTIVLLQIPELLWQHPALLLLVVGDLVAFGGRLLRRATGTDRSVVRYRWNLARVGRVVGIGRRPHQVRCASITETTGRR